MRLRATSSVRTLLFMCLAMSGLAQAQNSPKADPVPTGAPQKIQLYTKDNAPAAPKLDALPLKESVSQYGITWTFEKPARVGQFISGDSYVVGPVTVTGLNPAPRYG